MESSRSLPALEDLHEEIRTHGYMPAGFPDFGIGLTNRPPGSETEGWLLEHGYALAASQMSEGGTGYHVERGLREQIDEWDGLIQEFNGRTGATGAG